MSKCLAPHEVRLERELARLFKGLGQGDPFRRAISEGIHTLKRDLLAGKNVRKRQIPRYYVTKYGVNNLYILPLDKAGRLSYTLASDKTGINVVILEAFPDHKSYERRFGYR